MKKRILLVCFLSVTLTYCENVLAFGNKKTHPAITERSLGGSVIDDYLKTQTGFKNGVQTTSEWDFSSYLNVQKRIEAGKADPGKATRKYGVFEMGEK